MWKFAALPQITSALAILSLIIGCKPNRNSNESKIEPFEPQTFESLDYRYSLHLLNPTTAEWVNDGNSTSASYSMTDRRMIVQLKEQSNTVVFEKANDRWVTNAGLELIESSLVENLRRQKLEKQRATQIQDAESRRLEAMRLLKQRSGQP